MILVDIVTSRSVVTLDFQIGSDDDIPDNHDYFDIQISSDGNFSDIHNQFDTIISSERERAFLEAEMSVFLRR